MKILCIGRSGQVARSLIERSEMAGIDLIALGRPDLDLTKPVSVASAISEHSPTIIVNAAAYTAVDQAESDREAAFAINAHGVGMLAQQAHAHDIPLIHLSTDYVFDGISPDAYVESDHESPLGVYGASKFAGEELVRNNATRHVILRTAWVYSPFGKNFIKTMFRLANDRDSVSVVSDQTGNPTSAIDIANGIIEVCRRISLEDDVALYGTFHMTGGGSATWADLAELVFEIREQAGLGRIEVARIPSSAYPTPVKRPENSVLDCSKLETMYGILLPDWKSSARAVVERLLNEGDSSQ